MSLRAHHRLYGYGQLFAFSGIDGDTAGASDFCATLLHEPVTLRFETEPPVTLRLPLGANASFDAIGGDFIEGHGAEGGRLLVAYEDARTVVGLSPVEPQLEGDKQSLSLFTLASAPSPDGWLFRLASKALREDSTLAEISSSPNLPTSQKRKQFHAGYASPTRDEVCGTVAARRAWLEAQPSCPEPGFDGLWAKCLAIEKENTLSAEGAFPCRWTTPDRVPHRDAWLWDSAFHAMAMSGSDPALARDALRAVLARQHTDGFIPHYMRFDGRESSITQPQVLAWAALFLNERAPDADFLTWAAPHLQAFLDWTVANRDRNGNGLLEWHTGSDPNCRCDESGLDNSPRFDFDTDGIDAIDFSCYLAHEAGCLAEIWRLLGRDEKAAEADALRGRTAERINALLWDEASGLYFDRLFDGCLSHVATVASFLPLWAGVCPPERAARLVAVLTDPARFWTALPIPSVARDSACFDTDMWRGCSWLNLDYLIWLGLRRYGYEAKATELRHRVLASVNRWYLRHGTVFEFYDADDRISPFELKRKGPPVLPPDWRKHMHSITDYHWSACFTRLFLEKTAPSTSFRA